MVTTVLIVVIALVVLLLGSGVRMVQQYQRGVVLRFGRLLPEVRQPGLRLMVPIADRMVKVPVQTLVLDVPRKARSPRTTSRSAWTRSCTSGSPTR